jgi:hypothetical protein
MLITSGNVTPENRKISQLRTESVHTFCVNSKVIKSSNTTHTPIARMLLNHFTVNISKQCAESVSIININAYWRENNVSRCCSHGVQHTGIFFCKVPYSKYDALSKVVYADNIWTQMSTVIHQDIQRIHVRPIRRSDLKVMQSIPETKQLHNIFGRRIKPSLIEIYRLVRAVLFTGSRVYVTKL